MIPTIVTLAEYIEHEKVDYEARTEAGARGEIQERTLPEIDQQHVLYHICFIDGTFASETICGNQVKAWAGAPTAAILKAIHAILQPCVPTTVTVRMTNIEVVTGVPSDVRDVVTELIRLWSRPQPPVIPLPEELVEDPGSGSGGGAGGMGGGAAQGEGKGKKRAGDEAEGQGREKRTYNYQGNQMMLRPRRGRGKTTHYDASVRGSRQRVVPRTELVQKVLSWSADVRRAVARGEAPLGDSTCP